MTKPNILLTTQQLPEFTGLSESFFAKGRLYGYGPKYLKISTGKVLYREEDVLAWLASREFNPEAVHNV